MGGVVNIAIRFKDGTTVCQERWTNNIPYTLKTPGIYEGEQAARDYLAMVQNNDHVIDPHAPGSLQPVEDSEYGLVVIDYVSGRILDNNSYSGLNGFSTVYSGGDNRSEAFEECARAGRLRLRTVQKRRSDRAIISDERGPPLSEQEALDLGEKLYREDRLDSERGPIIVSRTFEIDTSPLVLERLPFDDPATMHARLVEIGFPLTAEEGVNAHLAPTPEARKVTKQEETARRLFQEWKKTEGLSGAAYDGVRYEDAPETLRTKLMTGAAAYLCDEDQLAFVLKDLG